VISTRAWWLRAAAAFKVRRIIRRVHFLRNLLAIVPQDQMYMAAALFRTIFAQPDADTPAASFEQVRDQLDARIPKKVKVSPYPNAHI